ncbi:hypothetical protein [Pseudobacteriovorax antillogorgiicola]|uniref:Right handed beta helix region n=1 Tax=Pseudobacteriovorax antillogorgiicola TaxID=1513793 RepID=A0A1Y6CGQ8_9BACT|nr:hypothetical protein [Pseudobacteriovorax antillogorgiicola]TCS48711.1 hypothetical protein EDD56_117133 [Pseudobacteriovorax antillogorgiicola]SMF54616.1 hypothetical protein SAMN06296036_11726 [Pseudobacteriovorax antillogorgiicola]
MKVKSILALTAGLTATGSVYAACPAGTKAESFKIDNKEVCALQGTYKSDLVLGADKVWVLEGGVFIGGDNTESASITFQPGAKIVGKSGSDFLVVNRGSQIFAEGTAQAPIVFTSSKAVGERRRGDWGGLIINGNAPINGCGNVALCEAEGEGSTGLYGGNDAFDNSGVLKYVRVEFAGNEITPENELNGIAFQGVGAGTTVDYIQVHMNADDGVEFFGGTVNAKHIHLTGNRDDSLDWVNGWTGKVQYVVVEQYGDEANNGIEADNLSSPQNAQPRSNPALSNMTFIGTTSEAAKGGAGMLLRRGTGADIMNTVVTGFKDSCIDIDDTETFGQVKISSTVVSCAKNFELEAGDVFNIQDWFLGNATNKVANPQLNGYVPAAGSPLLGAGVTPFDFYFDEVDYIGAIKDAASDWTVGWTTSARN